MGKTCDFAQSSMLVPRNVIYQMRFVASWLQQDSNSEAAFCSALSALLMNKERVIIPLGRARSGIYLLIKGAVTNVRRRVILSPYTIPDVVNMVLFAGGEPVFVDFRPNSTNLDLDHLASLVDDQTACVMVTHYHVSQAETPAIADLCNVRGIRFFDDCAISLGASYEGKPIGTVSDGSVLSFSAFKTLNFYWGGAVVASHDEGEAIASEVAEWPRLSFRQYLPQIKKVCLFAAATSRMLFPLVYGLRRRIIASGEIVDIYPVSRIETTHLDATIRSRPALAATSEWNRKFGEAADIISHRRQIAAIYDRHFRDINVSAETPEARRSESVFVNYPILVGLDRRDEIYRSALNHDFDVGLSLYPNVHEMEGFSKFRGQTTNVSRLVRSIISLPTHRRVTPEYAENLSVFLGRQLGRR
jgi:perosamine synthetase